jgi:cysteine-rich repeat protein
MNTSPHFGLLTALALVACNHTDTALFSDPGAEPLSSSGGSAAHPSDDQKAGGGSGATPSNSGGSDAAAATGGTDAAPSAGSSSGGQPQTAGSAGQSPTPDPSGTAGANDGSAGSGEPQKPDPVCGNGVIEAGEECDDAGHTGPDGCDAECRVVCADRGPGTIKSADYHCYNGYDAANFDGAIAACEKRGAHLVTVSSADENKIARMFVNDGKWIGGREDVPLTMMGSGQYAWLTGEPFTYTNWAKEEPNRLEYHCEGGGFNSHCYEHCITILGDGTWADRKCDVSDGYVCEWEPPSKP